MSLKRYFSEASEATKVKRKLYRNANYSVPILSEENKQVNYHTIVTTNILHLIAISSRLKKLFLYKCLVNI